MNLCSGLATRCLHLPPASTGMLFRPGYVYPLSHTASPARTPRIHAAAPTPATVLALTSRLRIPSGHVPAVSSTRHPPYAAPAHTPSPTTLSHTYTLDYTNPSINFNHALPTPTFCSSAHVPSPTTLSHGIMASSCTRCRA